jgi:rhamnose utilization protein RhaD (predicted bifunctional aldolase and dehydrogenase)/NAD(P)-dependent dehydrogenase (short-subunit alcohol dehydrogenase family)
VLSRWNDDEAAACDGDLALRVYTSRLLGREPSLVLHGGGNTSVKLQIETILGRQEDVLFVKGSGWDLATIEAPGFSPARLDHLLGLAELERLTDEQMAAELRVALTDATAPSPSVEAILHAVLPYRFVDHTHADAVVALTNTPSGEQRARELYPDAVIVPYVMPGFDLARAAAKAYAEEATGDTVGLILLNHGVFSFGDTARRSYERMIALVTRAEDYLRANDAWTPPAAAPAGDRRPARESVAALRAAVADAAGAPVVLRVSPDPAARAFAQRPDVAALSQQGPATPDHVLRTKRVPLVGRDVETFAADYEDYFREHAARTERPLAMLDPAPRVVLDPELGLCTVGRTARDARIVEDIYLQTIEIILRSTALERYRALPAADLFDVEYWDLEQAKLRRAGDPPPLAGEVALVTGAASGIGKACVAALAARGAAVVGLDRDPVVESAGAGDGYLGLRCDVTSDADVAAALDAAVLAFGGLDMLVLNAGVFPPGRRIDALDLEQWRATMRVNLDANLVLLHEAAPLLRRAPRYGRVVVVGSKNVPAPGPGAAAYSASKAAVTQLARVAALEWGGDGIRVNVVHPNAVYDTAIWTDEVLAERAASYGLTVDEYRRNNVLGVEVGSGDVAELVATLCGPAFAKTTGAQIPIDGGNDRVI